MTISAVILNWNRWEETVRAARSVLELMSARDELIIWDNASNPSAMKTMPPELKYESRVRIIPSPENYGVAGGRNRAFRETAGELIVSLDSDAVFSSPNAFDTIRNHFIAHERTGVLAFEVIRPDGHLMWPFARDANQWRHRPFDTIRMDGCGFCVRKYVFEQAGGFAEHFSPYGAEDQHFSHKVISLGYDIIYEPSITIEHAFSSRGRTPIQFRMHVRNMLWIPLELFPFPYAIFSFLRSAWSLRKDAIEEYALPAWRSGLIDAITGFRIGHRHPYTLRQWHHFRSLVAEDKAKASHFG